MSIKDFDFKKEVTEKKTYERIRPIGAFVNKCNFKIEYVGAENIPDEGGFVLASNHIHLLDPLVIGIGIKNRQLHFMAKKELWKHFITAWAFSTVNGFPIARGAADTEEGLYSRYIPRRNTLKGR